ncbi:MAG TPA: 8-oxo-dGTP diphosphatase [Candidatus Saccharimonadales bacterium]|nr:8-oxo-dGTP diphosphatase [Candidatus Saccharimonadales bacterium]
MTSSSDKTTTLLFLRRGNEVLLAMKKRGFGKGRWNGTGGKVDPGETVEQAMVRECQEEIEVTPTKYYKAAEHDFVLNAGQAGEWHMHCHAFVCSGWEGEPAETEEMAPRWFKVSEVPYDQMWQDDRHWMPQVFDGKRLRTHFTFDEHDNMLSKEITVVAEL